MSNFIVFVLVLLANWSLGAEGVQLQGESCTGRPAYICDVVLPNFCQGLTECAADPVFVFPGDATPYGFNNFNAISFDSFNSDSGDVEGRVAVRNTMNVNAYSVGYMTSYTEDNQLPFALVIGQEGTFNYGSVHPNNEGILAGISFTAQPYLTTRATVGFPTSEATFSNAQNYYLQLSFGFASTTPNAEVYFEWGALALNCSSDPTATSYTVNVDAESFSVINAYKQFIGCNPDAQYIFNIGGNGDVTFTGNYILHAPETVLYNILGGGRTIHIKTGVRGNILAPFNNFYQDTGLVDGYVIAGNMQRVLQINKPHCHHHNPYPHQNCSSTTNQPVTSQAITSQALTTRALTTQAVTSQAVTSQAVTSNRLTTQSVTSQALTTNEVTSAPLTTQAVTSAPLTTQAVTSAPLTTQAVTSAPLTTQAVTSAPLTTQAVTSAPLTTQPLTTQPLTTNPLTTQDVTSAPLTTQAVTSAPLTTQPVTSSPLTTQDVTSSPLTTQPLTTQPLTTNPLTTQPVTSAPLTTQPVTSAPLTTQPVTSAPLTTQPVTSAPLTTQPVTSAPLTTQPVTSAPLTTQPVTSAPLTTQPVTSAPLTTQPVTSSPLTTQPVTSSPLTTQSLTTQPLSTRAVTSNSLTTQSLTTQTLTTRVVSTGFITTQPFTSGRRGPSKK